MTDFHFTPADDQHIQREKAKARDLRQSPWWKNQLGNGLCYYCKQRFHPSELTMDHIVPVIRGGLSSKSNCVPCCKTCNSNKKYLLPVEWTQYLQSLRQAPPGRPAPPVDQASGGSTPPPAPPST